MERGHSYGGYHLGSRGTMCLSNVAEEEETGKIGMP